MTKFDFKIFEEQILETRNKYKSGETTFYSPDLNDSINEYIRLSINKHNFPLWFSLDRNVLIARINRRIFDKITMSEYLSSDMQLWHDLEYLISHEIRKNIDRQKEFRISLEFPDKTKREIQQMPRTPVKGESILHENRNYIVDNVKWDVTNGNTILELI